jgi:hypothetical protein
MPTISMFFGIIIRMYYAPKEHNSAHIHVYYNEYIAVINILSMEIVGIYLICRINLRIMLISFII